MVVAVSSVCPNLFTCSSSNRHPPLEFLSPQTGQSKYADFSELELTSILIAMLQDNYLDAYVRVIRATDPLRTALVFSCGMGAVRTTFAMVAACLVRRKQLVAQGIPDPYATKIPSIAPTPVIANSSNSVSGKQLHCQLTNIRIGASQRQQ